MQIPVYIVVFLYSFATKTCINNQFYRNISTFCIEVSDDVLHFKISVAYETVLLKEMNEYTRQTCTEVCGLNPVSTSNAAFISSVFMAGRRASHFTVTTALSAV